jgi:hypothetical protein
MNICTFSTSWRQTNLSLSNPIYDPAHFLVNTLTLTSLPTKVRVFSDIFRDRKTKVAYFTSQFLNNYKLRPYIIQAHTIKEARLSLEGVQIKF